MPTSPYSQIDTVVYFLHKLMPSSMLDIGVGNGKMGFVARDSLDVMLGGRFRREAWQIRIDGIEIFAPYIQDHQKAIYDTIHIGDVLKIIGNLPAYDLIIISDVLEHFEKEKARLLLDRCAARTKHIMLNIPLSETWTQEDIYGNPHERHLSFWSRDDFLPFVCAKAFFSFDIGEYGGFLIDTGDYIAYRRTGETVRMQIELKMTWTLARQEC